MDTIPSVQNKDLNIQFKSYTTGIKNGIEQEMPIVKRLRN